MTAPIIKWAGGKKQLLSEIIERMPKQFNKYYEPFFGGGALYFALNPINAIINDSNNQLINVYKQIRDNLKEVIYYLEKYQNTYNQYLDLEWHNKCYFRNREKFNTFIENNIFTPESAALFIILNKSGFNGLYRVNSKGLFNVPPNHCKILNSFDRDNLMEVSQQLKNTAILQGDFEKACETVEKNDFVFFDSPYYDTFDTYQAKGFSKEDHERLAKLYQELTNKGAYCLLTNSDSEFIRELYSEFKIETLQVKRSINCDGANRKGTELIISNFII